MSIDWASEISACVSYEDFVKNLPLSRDDVDHARKIFLDDQEFCDLLTGYASPATEDDETALTLLRRATNRFKFRAWLVALKRIDQIEEIYSLEEVVLTFLNAIGLNALGIECLISRREDGLHYSTIFDGPTAPVDEPFVKFEFGETFRKVLTREGRGMQELLGIPLGTYHCANIG